jgi:hypothetical protein
MKIYVKITDDRNQSYEGTFDLIKSKKTKTLIPKQITTKPKGAASFILYLYNQHFFEKGKTLNDVEKEIKNQKYGLAPNAINNALQRAKFLRRIGTRGKYAFIQKIPPN